MIEIPIEQVELPLYGHSGLVMWKNQVWKFEDLPEEDTSDKMAEMKRRRNWLEGEKYDLFTEQKAVRVARSLNIPTPEPFISDVILMDNGKRFPTKAMHRYKVPGKVFTTIFDLYNKFPVAYRSDYMYLHLVDFLMGTWDRNPGNLIYNKKHDLFIPIDFESSFSYDRIPMNEFGAETVFQKLMLNAQHTNFYRLNVLWFGSIFQKLCQSINVTFLHSIDPELINRATAMQQVLTKFLLKFKIGLDNWGIDLHGDFIRSILKNKQPFTVHHNPTGKQYSIGR